jgi:SAM-dependent methyltransferase
MSGQDYYDWQHGYWADHAVEWEKWAEIVAPQAAGFNRPVIEAAKIGPGNKVLDLACGAGEPALTAAGEVGDSGHVTASDYSTEMLAVAERRATAQNIANMSFQQADMRELPFEAESFDQVISRFGFMYTEAPDQTAAEIFRVLRPGGRVALMVWGPMQNNTVLSVALEAANAELNVLDADAADHPGIYGQVGSLSRIFDAAGFVETKEQDIKFEPSIPVGTPFWKPIIGMNLGSAMRGMAKEDLAKLDEAIANAHAPYLRDGKYHLQAHIRILVANKPNAGS